ncbi:hypothetical protein BCF74_12065 [Knoellia remsis]|uniref:DUF6318 domain-containing protein n=1 Tax=Knoellia remsis TaxID=407159 RepID=A0A2T0UDU3_9MICO|nr:DUF6318 family protein [Knoellia remsis]PRY56115.1 hypothetical protein BCF74_12065 [Knoellia remsis]
MRSRTPHLVAGLVLTAVVGVAGCTTDEPTATGSGSSRTTAASPSGAASASPSLTSSPTESAGSATPDGLPSTVLDDTPAGAAAFVAFWFERANLAFTTGTPDAIAELSASSCAGCAALVANSSELARRKWTVQPSPYQPLTEVAASGPDGEGRVTVTFTLRENDTKVMNDFREVVETRPGQSTRRTAVVGRAGSSWILNELTTTSR